MANSITLTFVLMDPPFESARTTTAMRLLDEAVRRGYHVKVFAYEGAVMLPFKHQSKHANAVHGHDVETENHPLGREWVAALMSTAKQHGSELVWINCGLCVDERGAMDAIEGVKRGSPADLVGFIEEATNTLVIPTR